MRVIRCPSLIAVAVILGSLLSGCVQYVEHDDPPVVPPPPEEQDDPELPPGTLKTVYAEGVGPTVKAASDEAVIHALTEAGATVDVRGTSTLQGERMTGGVTTYIRGTIERIEGKLKYETLPDGTHKVSGTYVVRVRKVQSGWNRPGRTQGTRSIGEQATLEIVKGRQMDAAAQLASDALQDGVFHQLVLNVVALPWEKVEAGPEYMTIDVPVRVWVDAGEWKAWLDDLSDALSRLSETRGLEGWSVRQGEWIRMDQVRGLGVADRSDARSDPLLARFVPRDERIGSIFFPERSGPAALAPPKCLRKERCLAVAEATGEGVRWWTLPPQTWEAVRRSVGQAPSLSVGIIDRDGRPMAQPIEAWTGCPRLRLDVREGMTSHLVLDWSLTPRGMKGLDDWGAMLIPFGTARVSGADGSGFALLQQSVIRFRFRVQNQLVADLAPEDQRIRISWAAAQD